MKYRAFSAQMGYFSVLRAAFILAIRSVMARTSGFGFG
jgi:hypothetical protein